VEVREVALSDPATLQSILGLQGVASKDQKAAIGTGLAQAERFIAGSNPHYANDIQRAVLQTEDQQLILAYEVTEATMGEYHIAIRGGAVGFGGGVSDGALPLAAQGKASRVAGPSARSASVTASANNAASITLGPPTTTSPVLTVASIPVGSATSGGLPTPFSPGTAVASVINQGLQSAVAPSSSILPIGAGVTPIVTLPVVPPTITLSIIPPTVTLPVVPPTVTLPLVPPTITVSVIPPTVTLPVAPSTIPALPDIIAASHGAQTPPTAPLPFAPTITGPTRVIPTTVSEPVSPY
jgi:hypothetical protein